MLTKLSLVLVCIFGLMGCTKHKCIGIDIQEQGSVNIITPSTSWLDADLGAVHITGPAKYRSCPKGEDPQWMQLPAP